MIDRKLLASGFLIAVGLSLGIGIGTLRAAGVPQSNPLFYSGTLTESGQPVTGAREIEVSLWSDQTSPAASYQTCSVKENAQIDAGRFRVALPDKCITAIHTEADQWVEVRVGGTLIGNERAKLGAVPYALEADRASGAAGELEKSIAALQRRIDALEKASPSMSAFRAYTTVAQNTVGTYSKINFETEEFDLGKEYDSRSSVFTTKAGGYYEVGCTVTWESVITASGQMGVWVNGLMQIYNGGAASNLFQTTRHARSVLQLEAGDTVYCMAASSDSAPQPLYTPDSSTVFFEAIRLSPLEPLSDSDGGS